uniref:Putative tail component n=1 Tax=Siphoviridae sp. ct5Px37 TaxID=2826293 RepID=A0A8S5N4C8_9CAUD|nr:MAG TPA: putative tail component [Siphoviridae sp. ct5Px37]
MMGGVKIVGLEKLQKKLKKNARMEDVKRVIRHNGSQLQAGIQSNADFSKGYQTGATKRSVGLDMKDNGLTAESGPTTEYAEYLEYGTRFMEAQPFIKPAFDKQAEKFKRDMKKLTE